MLDLTRKFWFVTGKGGVGKSTIAAALAVAMSLRGRRVLLCASGDAGTVDHLFGGAFGHTLQRDSGEPTQVAPGLWTLYIDPALAVVEYGGLVLRSQWASRRLFGNSAVRRLVDAVPGIQPWAILGKATYHSRRVGVAQDAEADFDAVILDAPATGHALQMLRVPMILSDLAKGGALGHDAQETWRLLRDPAHTAVVLVSLLEGLPVAETRELAEQLQQLSLPLELLVLNRERAAEFSSAECESLRRLGQSLVDGDLQGPETEALRWAWQQAERQGQQAEWKASLQEVEPLRGVATVSLPNLLVEPAESKLRRLAAAFGSRDQVLEAT